MLLFLPGIIATIIIDLLTTHRKRQSIHFILHSYLLSMASYGLLLLIVYVNNRLVIEKDLIPTWEVSFLRSLLNNNAEIHINEVFIASFIGIIIGLVFVVVINKKYVYTISNLFQISNKHGEDDVWDFLLSSNDIEWVTIRDYDTMLVYQGAVIAFSQKDNKRELVLGDVNVYKEEGQELRFLHDMKFNYINFNIESKIIIEIYESEDEASGE